MSEEKLPPIKTKSVFQNLLNLFKTLSISESGWTANRREWRRWSRTHSEDAAPIISSHFAGFLIVQVRAIQNEALPDRIISVASMSGDGGPTDDRPPNKGWLNGRMVWIDYGQSVSPIG